MNDLVGQWVPRDETRVVWLRIRRVNTAQVRLTSRANILAQFMLVKIITIPAHLQEHPTK